MLAPSLISWIKKILCVCVWACSCGWVYGCSCGCGQTIWRAKLMDERAGFYTGSFGHRNAIIILDTQMLLKRRYFNMYLTNAKFFWGIIVGVTCSCFWVVFILFIIIFLLYMKRIIMLNLLWGISEIIKEHSRVHTVDECSNVFPCIRKSIKS